MKEVEISRQAKTPILFPYEPTTYWESIRNIIREEINVREKAEPKNLKFETPRLTYKPLYKIAEVCQIFQITKPTIYEGLSMENLSRLKFVREFISFGRI
jgi:hypothetical protein